MSDSLRPAPLSVRRPRAVEPTEPAKVGTGQEPAVQTPPAAPAARTLNSSTLLQGHSYVSILHNGETYQLRATRLGKLILTK